MPPIPTTDSQPPPPIRTSTTSSTISQTSSAPMSPDYAAQPSPKSYISRHSTQGLPSPTESSFFEVLASKVRRGRSRSRSRKGVPRHRSKSPIPPDQLPASPSELSQMSPPSSPRAQQQPRHFPDASRSSINSTNNHPKRPSPGPVRRNTASSDPWRGRHSNSWLFNDFSVTNHVKEFCHIGRNSRS